MQVAVFAVFAIAMLVAGCTGDDSKPTSMTATTPEQMPTVDPRAPPTLGPFVPPPDGPVAFKVCLERTDWRRLTPAEMPEAFRDMRFRGPEGLEPYAYAVYLSDIQYIDVPDSASIFKTFAVFSGVNQLYGGRPSKADCGDESLRYPGVAGGWRLVWLEGYRIVSLDRWGPKLTMVVDPAPGVFQEVVFPYPPIVGLDRRAIDFTYIRFLDRDSDNIYEVWREGSNGQRQTDGMGRLRFALFCWPGRPGMGSSPDGAIPGGQRLRLYAYGGSGLPPLVVHDQRGREVIRAGPWSTIRAWDVLMDLDLPPGGYRLSFDGEPPRGAGVLVLPADHLIPPEVLAPPTPAGTAAPPR